MIWTIGKYNLSFENSSVIRGGENFESPQIFWKQKFLHSNQSSTKEILCILAWILLANLMSSIAAFEKLHYLYSFYSYNQLFHFLDFQFG